MKIIAFPPNLGKRGMFRTIKILKNETFHKAEVSYLGGVEGKPYL